MHLLLEQYCAVAQRSNQKEQLTFKPGNALYLAVSSTDTFIDCLKEAHTLLPSQIAVSPQPINAFSSCVWGVALEGGAAAELAALLKGVAFAEQSSCPGCADIIRTLSHSMADTPVEESILCYTAVCRIAESLPGRPAAPPLVQDALQLIRTHYSDVYGVEELAEQMAVSKSHLIRVFTAFVGQSPGRYLNEVRLHAAKSLLQNHSYSLETVANLCGFSGANYFCRIFKKHTGQTPAAWRKLYSPPEDKLPFSEAEAMMYL